MFSFAPGNFKVVTENVSHIVRGSLLPSKVVRMEYIRRLIATQNNQFIFLLCTEREKERERERKQLDKDAVL